MTTVLELMATLQNNLNEEIVSDWKNVRTIQEFETNCLREIIEMIECVPDKWWKHYTEEEIELLAEKIKLELVDVLHFALSAAMLEESITEKILVVPMRSADVENYKKLIDLTRAYNFMGLVYQLSHLANCLKFDMCGFYIAKYTLNRIRLLKGYKHGTYKIKTNNMEDNVILLKLLPNILFVTQLNDTLTPEKCKVYIEMVDKIYNEFQIPLEERVDIFE